jgi:hypothetical protein
MAAVRTADVAQSLPTPCAKHVAVSSFAKTETGQAAELLKSVHYI